MDHYPLNEDGTSNLMTIIFIPFGAETMHMPTLSTRQIVCTPSITTAKEGDLYKTMKTPSAVFDIGKFLSVLPPEQAPEVIIVWADSSMTMFPINLEKFSNCRKLFMVGDTHHQSDPLQSLLVYALNTSFDAIVFMFRQHVHFFRDAGFPNVDWIQGPMTFPEVKPIKADRRKQIVLLGSKGDQHPQRRRIVDELERSNYPLVTGFFPHSAAMNLYSEVQIALNISLNGDMNWRPYEVLGAGGFLITDKLSHFSGLDILFEEGEHYICFSSIAELKAKLDYYLENPDECLEIARRGQDRYLNHLSRDHITRTVWDKILNNRLPDIFQVDPNERLSVTYEKITDMFPRIALYETVQEFQRISAKVRILFLSGSPLISVSDCADLPRVEIYIESHDAKPIEDLKNVVRYKPIAYIDPASMQDNDWDIIVAPYPATAHTITKIYKTKKIIIAGHPFSSDHGPLLDECPPGFIASSRGYAIFERNPARYLKDFAQLYGDTGAMMGKIAMAIGLRDKRVIEIGHSIPEALAVESGAVSWLSLADEAHGMKVISPLEDKIKLESLETVPNYAAYRARIMDLPATFHGQFDLVYSYQEIPNINYILPLLQGAYNALKPGGKLFFLVDPVWSAHDGHNLPKIIDAKGREFSRNNSGIPPWGHLLMTEEELSAHLLEQTDASTVSKIINHIYKTPYLNRLFVEDYSKCIEQVPFRVGLGRAGDIIEPPAEILNALKKKYPGYSKFDHCGLHYELRK